MIHNRANFEDLDWECPYCGFTVRLVSLDSSESYSYPRDMMGVEELVADYDNRREVDAVIYVIFRMRMPEGCVQKENFCEVNQIRRRQSENSRSLPLSQRPG
jgi:hypothetical protein